MPIGTPRGFSFCLLFKHLFLWEAERQRKRESEFRFNGLLSKCMGWPGWDLGRLKPRARNATQASHVSGRNPVTQAITAASQGLSLEHTHSDEGCRILTPKPHTCPPWFMNVSVFIRIFMEVNLKARLQKASQELQQANRAGTVCLPCCHLNIYLLSAENVLEDAQVPKDSICALQQGSVHQRVQNRSVPTQWAVHSGEEPSELTAGSRRWMAAYIA